MSLYIELYILYYSTLYQFRLIFLYWFAGVVAGAFVSTFSGAGKGSLVARISGGRYRWTGSLWAALLGVASPVCMYGTIPMIAALGRKGVPQYLLATFMVSSILLNPNLLIFSFVLGAPMALLRLFACMAAGMAAGFLVHVFYKSRTLFRFDGFAEVEKCSGNRTGIKRFAHNFHKTVIITAPYLLAGIVLTALFDRYFPQELFAAIFSRNKGMGVLLAASIGVPVYLCGGGTIPIIKAWMEAGMSNGSALAFMITGPATKLTNLGAVKIILGAGNFTVYIIFNIFTAIAFGWITDLSAAIMK